MYSFIHSTDGSSDVDDKYFPVLLTHWYTSGVVVTSFLDMPIVNQADAENITNACLKSLDKFNLDISRRVAFKSSNNASVSLCLIRYLQQQQLAAGNELCVDRPTLSDTNY